MDVMSLQLCPASVLSSSALASVPPASDDSVKNYSPILR